jgi:hypothetical protein
MVWTALAAALLMTAAPVVAGDFLPEGVSDVCAAQTDQVIVVFIGDGASARCEAVYNPQSVGPGGWNQVSTDVVAAQELPVCAFRTNGMDDGQRVLMRVYAAGPAAPPPMLALQICTGRTQFFPNIDDFSPA